MPVACMLRLQAERQSSGMTTKLRSQATDCRLLEMIDSVWAWSAAAAAAAAAVNLLLLTMRHCAVMRFVVQQ